MRIMTKTVQFGGYHVKAGTQVYARRIKGIGRNYILSTSKHCPTGATVSGAMLDAITEVVA